VRSIEPGKQANLIVLDDNFRVTRTFLHGREVPRRGTQPCATDD